MESNRSKQSLQHILTSEPGTSPPAATKGRSSSSHAETPTQQQLVWVEGNAGNAEENNTSGYDPFARAAEWNAEDNAPAQSRRNASSAVGASVYAGTKIRHLKKEDGIPLWRKDIQLEFLRCVFDDRTNVFTKFSDGAKNCSFAEIYVDSMARSGKTSKVLRDKMLADHVGAANMAMICLLVNVGRMNTTLNCE